MLCKKCGRTLPDDSLFCQYCGAHFEDLAEEAEPVVEEPVVEEPVVEEPEATKAAPAEEPPAAAPAEPKQPAGKATYCKQCGGLVDPETKKCTKCGKQYFKLPKNIVRNSLIALLFFAMAGGLVYLYMQNQALSPNSENAVDMGSLREHIRDIVEEEKEMDERELGFYHDHAVVVQDDDQFYHRYGCSRLAYYNNDIWILNQEIAEAYGYYPCSECQ